MTAALKLLTVLAAFAAVPALAAEPDAHASHHPAAQVEPAPVTVQKGAMGGGAMMGEGMMGMNGMSCMTAPRLAALKSDLALTPAQAPLWDSFADAIQSMGQGMGMHGAGTAQGMPMQPGAGMQAGAGQSGMMTGSLPERIDRHEAMMTAHLDALRKVKAALTPLYAAFTAEQRAKADAATVCAPPGH